MEGDDPHARCDCCPRGCRIEPSRTAACGALRLVDGVLRRVSGGADFRLAPPEVAFPATLPEVRFLRVATPGSGLLPESQRKGWESRSLAAPRLSVHEAIFLARSWRCDGVFVADDDPFFLKDLGRELFVAARLARLVTAVTTSGYLSATSRRRLLEGVTAVRVVLWSAGEELYLRRFGVHPDPIFRTLEWLRRETHAVVEVVVPHLRGENDSAVEIARIHELVARTLGGGTPIRWQPVS